MIPRHLREIPDCPMCDGPCTHEFPRSDYVFPDRLPKGDPGNRTADPEPVKVKKANLRGRSKHGPTEDRAIHGPQEDRSR